MQSTVENHIKNVLPKVIEFRHLLHKFPELTWNEIQTSKSIEEELRLIDGLSIKTGIGKYGIIADLKGSNEGPTLALRADMDALPVTEQTQGIDYISQNQGVMHACGHDGHSANLLGAAKVLSHLRSHIRGTIRFIFQPAEEGGAGAKEMIRDGALEGVDRIYGLHGWPGLPIGQIYVRSGPLMAGNAEIRIKISGRGGHAAIPNECTDQVLAGCRIVEQLGTIRNRMLSPAEPFVLSLTQFHAGTASNVIPDMATIGGTMRYMNQKTYQFAAHAAQKIAKSVAQSMDLEAEIEIIPGYPPVINDLDATQFLRHMASAAIRQENVKDPGLPTMGSEDFSYFLEKIPGSYFFLGVDDGRNGGYPSLHHPEYDFNDDALPIGIKIFTYLALNYGQNEHQQS